MTQTYHLRFTLTNSDWQTAEDALSEFFEALVVKPVVDNDPTSDQQISLLFAKDIDPASVVAQVTDLLQACDVAVPEIVVEDMPDIDWLQHVYETLRPIVAGRFFVHGQHVTEAPPQNTIPIVIEAAAAFGTGEHPTTKGCLLMLDQYLNSETPKTILDMGCGSGVLAIAAVKALPTMGCVLGVDIDRESVRVAQSHAVANGCAADILFVQGDGFHTPQVAQYSPYDLVFGNILAQPLIDMAPLFVQHAARDLLLSGFTDEQSAYVEKAYIPLGCHIVKKESLEGWVTLWLRKNP